MADLKDLLKERQGDPMMEERDYAYSVFDAYIMSRRSGKKGRDNPPQLTYKPFATTRFAYHTPKDHKLAINLSRRVHSYFTSTFSKMPTLSKMPKDPDEASQALADRMSFWLDSVFVKSRVKAAQPRSASWLSNRGDTVYGVEWDSKTGDIWPRTYDPAWCYPMLEPFDLGGVADMLITFTVPRSYAEAAYEVSLPPSDKRDAQVYMYWDHKQRIVEVDNRRSKRYSFEHQLGRCPFRWVFGNSDGMYAQSDIRDVPSLQDFYNENLVLAMDSIRKQVDASWVIFGHNKTLVPEPGKAIGIPRPDAKLQRLEVGAEPQTMMAVMSMLEAGVESSTGISPVSSRGQVAGSASGAAVRNQVQAMEARNEARKAAFEDAYEQVGVLCLQVLERCMTKPIKLGLRDENKVYIELKPEDVDGHYLCEATYGGFVGMSLEQRIQASLQGLGRIYGLSTAVRLAQIPGASPAAIEKEVAQYQKDLAIQAASAQSIAQQVGQHAQATPQDMGQQPIPQGAVPQQATPAPPPGPSQMGVISLADIQRTLEPLKPKLHGSVWAIGELAVAGLAARPQLMVASEKDLPVVTTLMRGLRTYVMAGHPGDELPSLLVA